MRNRTLSPDSREHVSKTEDKSTDTPLDFVRISPRYRWGNRAAWGAVLGSLIGLILYAGYTFVEWVRGWR